MEAIFTILLHELPALIHAGAAKSAPLLWAGLGGAYSERSGVINIGLEGMMLAGAFAAVAGSWWTGMPWIGLLLGIMTGAAFGWLHAWITLYWKANQIISGMGINLLALGLTGFLLFQIFEARGNSPEVTNLPQWSGIPDIPFLSPLLFPLSYLHLLFALVWLSTLYAFYRTVFGLRLRACGENPSVVQSAGVHVNRYRYASVTLSGVLAGIGGVQLSLGDISQFSTGMTNGRGFIALAILICSGWRPGRLVGIGLCFGMMEALGERMQPVFPNVSPRLYLALPFILALAILALRPGQVRVPSALGRDESEV